MKVVLLNPPHTAIGSRIPDDHLPPLGLLCIGGPLLDDGHDVRLVDADRMGTPVAKVAELVMAHAPDMVMIGHSGSGSIHATVRQICRALKARQADLTIIYGGVYPTFHWDEILLASSDIDIIIRGEGERTARQLIRALVSGSPLAEISGIAFREAGNVRATAPAEVIENLDEYRVGWELIRHSDYSYWGGKRAVVVQFSRGCTHHCSYCGQRGFWTKWRHRDPLRFAQELARLHREEGVEVINFADELPTGSKEAWRTFLAALIAENVPLILVGSTRASDIVRDRDILHLYKRAGIIRLLLGIEAYSEEALTEIRKGGSVSENREAIQLLRQHDIIAMATYVVGFQEEHDADYWRSFRHLLSYDPDQVQLLYATPHRWTPFYGTVENRRVIQADTNKWDYKHQVLATPGVAPWRVFLWFKTIEFLVQARPRVLLRTLFHRDPGYRQAMRWYTRIGRRVWFHEVFEFLFRTKHEKNGPRLVEFMGPMFADREYALATRKQNPITETAGENQPTMAVPASASNR
ncbi:MAG: magnesium-protoporphyrin IX monomethyl ester anaerobic oxidative cyclase [Lentisphaeria bacterium]|nr:magnesium-protoporphyrin IX monomethyl ester anaerobic oxidative cyclase [Lentisphaeria bacterium]